jgi:Clostridial hydrophobic W
MTQDPALLLQQLNTLQVQILELVAASNLSPTPIVGEQTSISELKALLQRLSPPQQTGLRQQAIAILDRFLALVHQDQSHFPALVGYQQQVSQFRDKLLELPDSQLPPDVRNLVEGQHPVAIVLNLVDRGNLLGDAEWTRMAEVVTKTMGQPIAIALSRGKLVVQPPSVPSNSSPFVPTVPPTTQPAPAASSAKNDALIWGASPPTPAAKPSEPFITFGAKSLGLPEPASAVPQAAPQPQGEIALKVSVHVQGMGDREFGSQEWAGTRGQSKGIEGFSISLASPVPGLKLEYMAHLAGVGDTPWIDAGQYVGTRGENRRVEGFAVRLVGAESVKYDVCYVGHIQDMGDTPILSDGKYCGTRGKALRVEAMKVWIQSKV